MGDLDNTQGTGTQTPPDQNNQSTGNQTAQGQVQAPEVPSAGTIDYEKLASIIEGRQQATEESVLRGYLKEQGLSKDEMQLAIKAYKENKAANTVNVEDLQNEVETAKKNMHIAEIREKATLQAMTMGVDVKSIPYLLKLADLTNVSTDAGEISEDKIVEAINKVLEDVPMLKKKPGTQSQGFRIGGTGEEKDEATNVKKPVAQKKWNRFNN